MDAIFLTPDVTVDVSIKHSVSEAGALSIEITEGGPYKIRTATGREYAKIQTAIGRIDVDAAYTLLPSFMVGGVERERMDSLHPEVVWTVLLEVLRRSRVTEAQAGK